VLLLLLRLLLHGQQRLQELLQRRVGRHACLKQAEHILGLLLLLRL
jgi:hypothetical protein